MSSPGPSWLALTSSGLYPPPLCLPRGPVLASSCRFWPSSFSVISLPLQGLGRTTFPGCGCCCYLICQMPPAPVIGLSEGLTALYSGRLRAPDPNALKVSLRVEGSPALSLGTRGALRSLHLSITALTESCPGLGRRLLPPSKVGRSSYPIPASPGGRSAVVGWVRCGHLPLRSHYFLVSTRQVLPRV